MLAVVLLAGLDLKGFSGDHLGVLPASDEAARAMARFSIPKGFQIELVAAEPLLANPVAFCIDDQGRFYVAETFRIRDAVPDNRWHMDWLVDDLASRTVEDRVRMYRKFLGDKVDEWSVYPERVRRVVDTDGDGVADASTVFADNFRRPEDGIAAGVLAREGDVWFTCVPDLWRLRDGNDDGVADEQQSLHTGFGVRVAFFGHDLHGLTFGPDGKLYFSVGDRGLNVPMPEGRLAAIECGSVLRCHPDGSDLEIYATGLRNPQELAFDEFGNLFTCDNNSDSGDRARIVYVVEGGDSGWRMPYQYLQSPVPRGPWNEEKLWQPYCAGQAAFIVPPIANLTDGPSGLAYNPGVGLPSEYDRNFFIADFRGGSAISGIRRFRLEPSGAGFKMALGATFVWKIVATDVEFGYDGAMYLLDWVEGWTKTGKGRIYRVFHPDERAKGAPVAGLMAGGFDRYSPSELEQLLAHEDMRVRQRAQFALAKRAGGSDVLERVAKESAHRLARLHGIWGLGQIGRSQPDKLSPLTELLSDPEEEVRAQAARTLGDAGYAPAAHALMGCLKDESLRVRMLSAIALGKLHKPEATPALLEMLEENNDRDPYVRHAGVMGLVGSNDRARVQQAAQPSRPQPVRLAALLAMRRWRTAELSTFFAADGFSPALAEEAGRAVYDLPIEEAMPALAGLAGRSGLTNPLARRVIAANWRLGNEENASVAGIAADDTGDADIRLAALVALGDWNDPPVLDPVIGVYRPFGERSGEFGKTNFDRIAAIVIGAKDRPIRERAIELAGRYQTGAVLPELAAVFRDKEESARTRTLALNALAQIGHADLHELVREGLDDSQAAVRGEARRLLTQRDPKAAVPVLVRALETGEIAEKQQALESLALLESESSDEILANWLDQLAAGQVPAEIRLDIRLAAGKRSTPEIQERLSKYEGSLASAQPVEKHRDALAGGNAERGGKIFHEKAELACTKCHKMDGIGGDVGPDLSKIGGVKNREYLLEAIVDPNRTIAEGFDTVVLQFANGRVLTGVLREQTAEDLVLYDSENRKFTVRKEDVEEQQRGQSAMPDDAVGKMTEAELRDLIEFLATRK